MKKIFIAFFTFICTWPNQLYATSLSGCLDKFSDYSETYFDTTYQKEVKENERKNAKTPDVLGTRNLCIGSIMSLRSECVLYQCLEQNNMADEFVHIEIDRDITGSQTCQYAESIDCLNAPISEINDFLKIAGDSTSDMFLLDMDKVTTQIKQGRFSQIQIDSTPNVCFAQDSNGDTIWHAFLDHSVLSGLDLCLSIVPKSERHLLYNALLFEKNNAGVTAIAKAFKSNKLHTFTMLGQWFKQNKMNCHPIIDEVSAQSGIPKDELRDVLCAH